MPVPTADVAQQAEHRSATPATPVRPGPSASQSPWCNGSTASSNLVESGFESWRACFSTDVLRRERALCGGGADAFRGLPAVGGDPRGEIRSADFPCEQTVVQLTAAKPTPQGTAPPQAGRSARGDPLGGAGSNKETSRPQDSRLRLVFPCGCGETGRRTGLRNRRPRPWGFESLHPHSPSPTRRVDRRRTAEPARRCARDDRERLRSSADRAPGFEPGPQRFESSRRLHDDPGP